MKKQTTGTYEKIDEIGRNRRQEHGKKQTTGIYGEKHDRNTWKIIIMATGTSEKIDDVTICEKKIETTGTYEKYGRNK